MELDRAALGDADELLRRELQHERHDADVGVERLHRRRGLRRLERRELEDLESLFKRHDLHGVRLAALLVGRAEDACDRVAAGKKGFKDGFAEILLTDDCDAHGELSGK